jgi:DNA-3-methyladenine glycosylase I
MTEYHDTEWGRPLVEDKKILQAFFLDTFQAGLSWAIILSKKKNFQKAFANFNPVKIARYDRGEVRRLMGNSGIIRNKRKIEAAIQNAQKILTI